jgi:DNA end-binding protein Ku
MAMGLQLVDAMTSEFEAEKYKDNYNTALLDIISKKLEGKPIKAQQVAPQPTNVLDLMSRLKESLEHSRNGQSNGKRQTAANDAGKLTAKTGAKATAKGKPANQKAGQRKQHLKMVA